MYWPTLWTLTDLMASGKSINTIKQAMTTLKLVYAYLEEQGIQLEERLRSARFLERHELEGMYRYLKIPIRKVTNGKVVNISRFDEVSSGSFAIRLNYAKAFFVFVLEVYTFKHLHDEKKKKQMETVLNLVKAFFKARRPSIDKLTEPRMGLNKKDQEKLLSLIAVDGPKNPWKSEFVKVRNEAMIHLLLDSGMRRGELLTLKRSDLDIEQQTIKIEKKVEGLVDPRRYKPKVKTKSRLIPIKNSSTNKVYEFIIKYRSKGPIGKKHPYIFTTIKGKPLSIKSVNAIFHCMKVAMKGTELYPHALRHTFNSNLSDEFEKSKVAPELAEKIRIEVNGWSTNSQMAALYGRRHTREKAKEVILEQQLRMEK